MQYKMKMQYKRGVKVGGVYLGRCTREVGARSLVHVTWGSQEGITKEEALEGRGLKGGVSFAWWIASGQ